MSKERILLFTPFYPPYSGGASTFFSNLVDSLSDEFRYVVITSYHRDRPIVTVEDEATIYRVIPRIEWLPFPVRLLIESIPAFFFSLFLLLVKDINLIHSHSTSFATIGMATSAVVTRQPIIYDCQDEAFPPRLIKTGTTPYLFSCAPNIDELLVANGIPEEKIVRVPVSNPPYIREYIPMDTSDEAELRVIFVGSLRELKGVSLLLEGFRVLASEHDDVELVVVGEGNKEDEISDFVSRHGLSDQVELRGRLSHRDTLAQIAEADVLVLPSRSEGLPRVVTEALELGTPVVASRAGSIDEIVTDSDNGLLIERTADAISDELERLYHNKELRRSLAENAKETSKRDWEKAIEAVSEAYNNASD